MFKINAQTKMVLSGLLLAIGLILPIIFHAYSISGIIFLPMHIPVLLTGFICGWKYGLVVGLVVPILSSLFTGMPPLFPSAVAMAFELGTYGTITGLLNKNLNVLTSLIIAMLAGRVVLGIANAILYGFTTNSYTWALFVSGAFGTAWPGIVIQLILVPAIITALKNAKILGE